MGLMRSVSEKRLDLNDLVRPKHILPDLTAYWSPYPLDRMPLPYRANMVAEAHFQMGNHIQELNDLALSPNDVRSRTVLRNGLIDLRARMTKWHDDLPSGLRWEKPMPAGLFELQ